MPLHTRKQWCDFLKKKLVSEADISDILDSWAAAEVKSIKEVVLGERTEVHVHALGALHVFGGTVGRAWERGKSVRRAQAMALRKAREQDRMEEQAARGVGREEEML